MLHHVAVVRADVSEECSASIIRVTKIIELGTLAAANKCYVRERARQLLVTANVPSSPILVILMTGALHYSRTSVFTRATRLKFQKTAFLCSHDFKWLYIALAIPTLLWWWGLSAPETLRAMPAVA
jgi:hypothetical protein